MKLQHISGFTLLGCGLAAFPLCGNAQMIRGWYEAGAAQIRDSQIESVSGSPGYSGDVEFDTGFRFGLGLGYEVTRYVAVEVEGGFHYNGIKSITGASASDGQLYQVPVMANLVLQFPNKLNLVPVIGGGAGAVGCFLDANSISVGGTTFSGTETTWTFGYQGYAGLQYRFRPDMSLGVTYHFIVADGPSWSNGQGGSIALDSLQNQTLSLTFGFTF